MLNICFPLIWAMLSQQLLVLSLMLQHKRDILRWWEIWAPFHYSDVVMRTVASQITSLTIVYSTAYSGADQRKHQSSASLAFVQGIHEGPVNSPHKWPVTRKMFPFAGLNNSIGPIARNCPKWPSGNRICGPKLPVKLLILKIRATQTFSVIKQPTLYALEFER